MNPPSPSTLRASVIIPTYRDSEEVATTVASLCRQTLPADQFEVLVVDNSPSERLRIRVTEVTQGGVSVRYVPEPELGIANARHTGARQAQGEVLAFVDDDIVCEPEWLEHILEPFADPAVGCAGGKVLPAWPSPPPAWILACPGPLALLDLGDGVRPLQLPEVVYGCNFAIRRKLLFELGGFSPSLVGERYNGDGEIGLIWKVYASGSQVVYTGKAVVQHRIFPARLTLAYMSERFANQGIADSYSAFRKPGGLLWLPFRLPLLAVAALGYRGMAAVLKPGRGLRYYHSELYFAYCVARIRHDWELLTSRNFRQRVSRRDWINPPGPSTPAASSD